MEMKIWRLITMLMKTMMHEDEKNEVTEGDDDHHEHCSMLRAEEERFCCNDGETSLLLDKVCSHFNLNW